MVFIIKFPIKRGIHHALIAFKLEDLRNYTERMETVLQNQVDEFNEWYELQVKEVPVDV